MPQYILLGLLGFPVVMGVLSGWMTYTGYHLDGQTRKEEFSVPTVHACWETCLQETSFICLSVAYSAVGSRSCRLYDKKALSAHLDWAASSNFTYYEYCVNGTSTWAFYPNMVLDGHNVLALTLTGVDVPTCLDACRAQPTCASVDYKEDNLKCFMNDVQVLDVVIGTPAVWDTSRPEYDHYTPCVQVSFGPVYIPMSNARNLPHNRFQMGVLQTSVSIDVKTLEVYSKFRCPVFCHNDTSCLGFKFSTTSTPGMTVCHMILQI